MSGRARAGSFVPHASRSRLNDPTRRLHAFARWRRAMAERLMLDHSYLGVVLAALASSTQHVGCMPLFDGGQPPQGAASLRGLARADSHVRYQCIALACRDGRSRSTRSTRRGRGSIQWRVAFTVLSLRIQTMAVCYRVAGGGVPLCGRACAYYLPHVVSAVLVRSNRRIVFGTQLDDEM